MATIDDARITDLTVPLLSAARTSRVKYDADRNRFLLDGRYPNTEASNALVAMHEDVLIATWRAADEPGLVWVKPTARGDDLLDAAMEG